MRTMEFEDILYEVGEYGPYQKKLVYLFLVPSAILLPLFCMVNLFMVSSPDHWCSVPQLANYSNELQHQYIRPKIIRDGQEVYDSCSMYDIDYDEITRAGYTGNLSNFFNFTSANETLNSFATKPCDHGWVYDHTDYDETAVTSLDLVCSRAHFTSMVLSLGNVGVLIGTPIFGWLSDKIGRRSTFLITIFVFLFSTISPTFFVDLTSLLLFRGVINNLIFPSMYQIPYILMIEIVGPKARTGLNGMACISWVVGLAALPWIAYLTRHWIILNIVTMVAGLIYFAFWKYLPESPRWLVTQGRYLEAAEVITRIAINNNKPVPQDLLPQLKSVGKKMHLMDDSQKIQSPLLELIRRPKLRKNFLLICLSWIASSAAYMCIHLNIYNIYGNQFVNFFLLAIIEFPSYFVAWYLMETKLGRRWTNVLFMVGCGIALSLPALVPSSYTMFTNVMTFTGKFCISASFMVIYQQGAELFPTPIRNQGLSAGSMAASVVNIGIPYLAYLGYYGAWIPLLIIGLFTFVIGIVSTFLPETLNENLPQTIDDGESFGRGRKFFSFAKAKPLILDTSNGNGSCKTTSECTAMPVNNIDEDEERAKGNSADDDD